MLDTGNPRNVPFYQSLLVIEKSLVLSWAVFNNE